MGRLNQLLAVEKAVRTEAQRVLTNAYHKLQKAPLFQGQTRTYEPMNDGDTRFPDESQKPLANAHDTFDEGVVALIKQWNLEASKNASNLGATADVVVNDVTLLENVPTTTLLYLEKQLFDLATVANAIPTLDPAVEWDYDSAANIWRGKAVETVRTQKTPKTHVKYAATDKHPAQTEFYWEDVPVGTWTTTRLSTAMSDSQKRAIVKRIADLQAAVKQAREDANLVQVSNSTAGETLVDYILHG